MSDPILLIGPGTSLLRFTLLPGGVEVQCPGCAATLTLANGQTGHVALVHEDGCPVHARIRCAIERYERTSVLRG